MKKLEISSLENLAGGSSKTNWWGCGAGLLVVLGGAIAANPLAVIGGGMIADKYC